MAVAIFVLSTTPSIAEDVPKDMANIIRPIIGKYRIPGMAVGVVDGEETYVLNSGVASRETGSPVTNNTLFELGSISKTFTATLATYAQEEGYLSLLDKTEKYLPALAGSAFGSVQLFHLATHTAGGFPLQVPEEVKNNNQLMEYIKNWQPAHKAGTYRNYANPSIGMLGVITATSIGKDFEMLMEAQLFPALGMNSTYISVPESQMPDYAQGYTKEEGAPIRMASGMLSSEAYGVKSTLSDMIRYVQVHLNLVALDNTKLQHAVMKTHIPYFKVGQMAQGLIWEQYPYPVTLETLLEGNAMKMIFDAMPVTAIVPLPQPQESVWINKTGSTNGFGAYVAFIPQEKLGIVILANKNFPIEERIRIAHSILTLLMENRQKQ